MLPLLKKQVILSLAVSSIRGMDALQKDTTNKSANHHTDAVEALCAFADL